MNTTYTLSEPITVTLAGPAGERHETISEVTVRKPRAKDLRAIDTITGEVAQSIALAARLTGLTVAQADELDVADFQAIGAIIEGFTQPGRPTGGTS